MLNKNVLVTGGTGLLGQALAKELQQQKFNVHILSRQKINNPHYIQADLTQNYDLDQACAGQQFIFHLASFNPPKNAKDPEQGQAHFDVTVTGTQNLLKAAIANKVKRIIFVSSQRAIEAESDYGKAKQQAELLLMEAKEQIEISIIRLPALFTDDLNPIIKQILNNKLFLPNMGEQRSFIYINDAIAALILIANAKKANGEIFQATDGQSYSLYEIQQMTGSKRPIPLFLLIIMAKVGDILQWLLKRPMPINQQRLNKLKQSTWMDDQKLCQQLGYQAKMTLKQKLIEYIKNS